MRSEWNESHPSGSRSRVRCGIEKYAGQENRIWASVTSKINSHQSESSRQGVVHRVDIIPREVYNPQ
jgi:hypothetical protein